MRKPVSYTHLDVYKRQQESQQSQEEVTLRSLMDFMRTQSKNLQVTNENLKIMNEKLDKRNEKLEENKREQNENIAVIKENLEENRTKISL